MICGFTSASWLHRIFTQRGFLLYFGKPNISAVGHMEFHHTPSLSIYHPVGIMSILPEIA